MKNNLFKGFKQFINRGNIFELATGIIIGTAFTAIVTSLVNDVVMPLISRLINFDLTSAKWILRDEVLDGDEVVVSQISLNYGSFIQHVLNFFIIAIAVFVAYKSVIAIRNSYVKSEVKYVKKLKKKHPELFDEEDELGTRVYEKLKSKYPQYFENEIAAEIEAQKENAEVMLTPQEETNLLLTRLNENLEKAYNLKPEEEAQAE